MQLILPKISHPASRLSDPMAIKNIIFDFGGVIIDLDIPRTEKKFREFGPAKIDTGSSAADQAANFEQLVGRYETGTISSNEFRNIIKDHYLLAPTDKAVDETWNALLLDIPKPRIRLIEQVRKNHRIFMLTNTNEIHYLFYREKLRSQFGYDDFDSLFEKAYYSHRIGLKKPDAAIFRYVLNDSHLLPSETLFIDDTLMHVESARAVGIHAHCLQIQKGEQIMDLFLKD